LSWTSPRTWAVGDLVTAALLNLHLRDNLSVLGAHTHTGAAGDGSANIAPTTITMGGAIYQRRGADVTSASTLAIGTDGNYFWVLGSSTVNAITSRAAGTVIHLRFENGSTINHVPGALHTQTGSNWVAAAGSMMTLVSHVSGQWLELSRATSTASTMGYAWLIPDVIDGADAWATRSIAFGAPARFGSAQNTATFTFVIPTDMTTMVSANVYRVGGGIVSVLGAFSTLTPGAIATVSDTIGGSGSWYGLLVQWRA
jgi:hypothetical protein